MAKKNQPRNKKGQFQAYIPKPAKPPTAANLPKKHTPVSNPEMHNAMIGKRTSNAAGIHLDKRTKRARTRAAAKQKHINEQF